jgi:hypothetical protein
MPPKPSKKSEPDPEMPLAANPNLLRSRLYPILSDWYDGWMIVGVRAGATAPYKASDFQVVLKTTGKASRAGMEDAVLATAMLIAKARKMKADG